MGRVLIALGTLLLLAGSLALWAERSLVDSRGFAARAASTLQREPVRRALADVITDQVLEYGSAELVTVRPLLEAAAAELIGSPPFRAVWQTGMREAHASFFAGDDAFVLRLTDAMILLTALLERLDERWVGRLPEELRAELTVFRRRDFAAQTLALGARVRFLAWLLPLLALLTLAAGVATARSRAQAVARVGIGTAVVGLVLLGLLIVAAELTSTLFDPLALAEAVRAVNEVFGAGLQRVAVGFVALGLALAVAAASGPRTLDPRPLFRAAEARWEAAAQPPALRVTRALLALAAAAAFLVRPELALRAGAALIGLLVLAWALAEILEVADPEPGSVRRDRPAAGAVLRHALRWAFPVAVVATLALLAVRAPRNASLAPLAWSEPDACNGSPLLCDRTLPEVVLAATHNAMSASSERGWFFASHVGGIGDQLSAGIRGLLIDAWFGVAVEGGVRTDPFHTDDRAELVAQYGDEFVAARDRIAARMGLAGDDVPREVYLCHGFCELGATRLADSLTVVRDFLAANPRELVIVFVEDHVPAAAVAGVFREVGLDRMALTHRPGETWPTLAEMIERNQRILIMAERDGSGPDWYHAGFELTQETPYSFRSPEDLSCEPNRGLAESPIFQLNHWIERVTPSPADAENLNRYGFLLRRALQCQTERSRTPNLLAVNFYELGDVVRVADTLNGVTRSGN
jgi:hypothetical protein